jgi:flagellar hook-basal body complex protein FliE
MSYSVGLQAVNAYNNFSNATSVSNTAQTSNLKNASGAAKFQDMVNANFNQFASMTQAEILKQVSQANNLSNVALANNSLRNNQNNASFITDVVKDISEKVRKQEDLSLKRVVGEASVTEVAIDSVRAANVFKLAIEFRNKMQDFIDKTMNINI